MKAKVIKIIRKQIILIWIGFKMLKKNMKITLFNKMIANRNKTFKIMMKDIIGTFNNLMT